MYALFCFTGKQVSSSRSPAWTRMPKSLNSTYKKTKKQLYKHFLKLVQLLLRLTYFTLIYFYDRYFMQYVYM